MPAWRPVALLCILAASAAYLRSGELQQLYLQLNERPTRAPAASITNLQLHESADGAWKADFEYDFAGDPPGAVLSVWLVDPADRVPSHASRSGAPIAAKPGHHRQELALLRPAGDVPVREIQIRISGLLGNELTTLASASSAQPIRWQDPRQLALALDMVGTSAQVAQRAADMIDTGALGQAEVLLQNLLERDPAAAGAYVEMARIAIKREPGSGSLRRAESLLREALLLQPESAKARTVLANVFAFQHRFDDAQAQIEAAARSGSDDIWIWSGWGQLLEMQGKLPLALEKYRQATAMQAHTVGDALARKQAYARQLAILELSRDFPSMALVHQRRVADFGEQDCFRVDYARFTLQRLGDPQGVIERLAKTPPASCSAEVVREVLGLAKYLSSSEAGAEEVLALSGQARMLRRVSAKLLYELALSERGATALQRLLRAGEAVDQKDAYKNTALTYALDGGEIEAAQRLLKLGASPAVTVGPDDVPVALVPVFNHDRSGILLMRRSGINYASLRFRGATAIERARKMGDEPLVQMLTAAGGL